MGLTVSIQEALQRAIGHHRAGQLVEAERLYRAILQVQPRNADANHNLGQLARQVGKAREALPYLQAVVNANPAYIQYWQSLIAALIESGNREAARQVVIEAYNRGLGGQALEGLAETLDVAINNTPNNPSFTHTHTHTHTTC